MKMNMNVKCKECLESETYIILKIEDLGEATKISVVCCNCEHEDVIWV